MDDIEEIRKKRAIKVLITDIFMALSVTAIVFILIATVAGWRINSDLSFEQNGLVSLRTKPTGAKVIIDGKTDSVTTNASKMLTGGTHTIRLEKEGYTSWEKEVSITPGWLLRLEYPKLFKNYREQTIVKDFENIEFFHVSRDRTAAILAENKSTEWYYITDFNGNPIFRKIDIRGIFSNTEDGNFPYEIENVEWSKNNEKILIKTAGENSEWGIINLKDTKESVNLTTNYARYEANSNTILATESTTDNKTIVDAKFENEVGDKIIALVNNNLIRIDTAGKIVSEPLAEKVEGFKIYESSVIYSTIFEEDKKEINFLRLGEKTPITMKTISNGSAKITYNLSSFNDLNYITYTIDNHLYVHRAKDFPIADSETTMKKIIDEEIDFSALSSEVSFNNEFTVFRNNSRIIVFDAELDTYVQYDSQNQTTRFLDNYIMYRTDDNSGEILAWDFDGTNMRKLTSQSASNSFDALISANDQFFYYISKTDSNYSLIKEKIN